MPEQIVKLKKKQWYPILAPQQFNNVVIGETIVGDPQSMIGKTLTHSLMNLTNDMKRQNINIHFKVDRVENDKAITSITGYQLTASSIKRFVRRNSEKLDISFDCETADNVHLRIKPLIVSKTPVKSSVAKKLRNDIIEFLMKTISKITYEELLNELISHKIQAMMRESLNKLFPLKVCELRYVGIEANVKPQEMKAEIKE